MTKFNGIAEFVAAAEMRSFVLAAQHIGMTPSGVSKAVTRLEQRLGTKLFRRTTRSLTLTASGVVFYQRCRHIMLGLRDAESFVSGDAKQPRGTIRVDLPPLFGRVCIMPALPAFAAKYPDLFVQVVFRRQQMDLFDEGIDVAVRVGTVNMSTVTSRCIGTTRYVTCASPSYLKHHGCPERPEDLLRHNCLTFVSPDTGQPKEWRFADGRASFGLAVTGSLALGNTDGLLASAVQGLGIAQVPDYMVRQPLKKETLAPILEEYVDHERPIAILTPPSREIPPKVQSFIAHVSQVVATMTQTAGRR